MGTKTVVPRSNLEICRRLWPLMSDTFKARIPEPTQAELAKWGLMITSDEFQKEGNEFIDALINRIGAVKIRQKLLTNKLAPFKKESINYGDTIEEIFVDIVKGHSYDPVNALDQFEKFKPDVQSMFHKQNSHLYYVITIQFESLRKAFTSDGGLARLVDAAIGSVHSSASYDEYVIMKNMFSTYINAPDMPLRPDQTVTTTLPVDEASGKAFYKDLLGGVSAIEFASRGFNPAQVMTRADPGEMALFVKASIIPTLNVDVLSAAFNRNDIPPAGVPIITLDDFGDNTDDTIAILTHRDWFMVHPVLQTTRRAENARCLYWNYYLHKWDYFSASYFMPTLIYKVGP